MSDGYGGARVVKFSRDGKYLLEWGKRGTGPGEFGLPHNVVVDAQGQVYVTDRDNQRIEIFDANGKFLTEWKNTGGVSGLALTSDGRIVTGAVVRDLKGNVFGKLPDDAGAHGAAVDDAGNIYLAQLTGIVQKFVKQRNSKRLWRTMSLRRVSYFLPSVSCSSCHVPRAFAQNKPKEKPKEEVKAHKASIGAVGGAQHAR